MLPPFRRLEQVFGTALDNVGESSIRGLVGTSEAEDLDFKGALYPDGRDEKKRTEIAKDIAALANHRGGAILLGVHAPKPAGVCTDAPGVALSDDEETRMRQLAADRLAPMADWHLCAVRSDADPNHGWYLIVVPPSSFAPHAVRVGTGSDSSWRYPVRDGTTTRFMSESEIASRYRNRFSLATEQSSHLNAMHAAAVADVNDRSRVFLAVTVLPTRPGEVRLTRETPRDIASAYGSRPFFRFTSTWFTGVGGIPSIGPGRAELRHSPDDGGIYFGAAHFGTDGACSIVTCVGNTAGTTGVAVGAAHEVIDELLLHELVDSLTTAAWYATELAGTSGDALARVEVRTAEGIGSVLLVRSTSSGPDRRWSSREATQPLAAETMIELSDFTTLDWQSRLRAVAFTTQRIYQAFGLASCPQLTEDGRVRHRQFGYSWRQIEQQAADYGITLATDMP